MVLGAVDMASLPLALAGGRAEAATCAHALPESFPLFRSHGLPALDRAFVHALGYATAETGATRAVMAKSAEEDAAQQPNSNRLPEGNLAPAEERRKQPVPQAHYDFAADVGKQQNPQNCERSHQQNPFSFASHFSSSRFRKFVEDSLQSLAQMQHRIAFARQQRIQAHAGLGGQFPEAAPVQLVGNKHLALLLR